MEEKIEEKIKDSLMKGTDDSTQLKGYVWNNIMNAIETEERKKENSASKRRKWTLKKISLATAAAAVLLVVFFTTTQPGQASFDKIKEWLVPEKEITEQIEGINEKTDVTLQEREMGYAIYFDEDMYKLTSSNNVDRITPKADLPEYLPEVFMEIHQVKNKSPKTLAAQIENDLRENYSTVINKGETVNPIKGIMLYAEGGSQWDDTVERYYLVDNNQGGTFIIKQKFFLEATEGHGARFDNMLKEFKIMPLN